MVALLTVAEGDQNRNLLCFLLLYPIFTLRLVCHGETLVKLQTVSDKYCSALVWLRYPIPKNLHIFSQDNILGLSYWKRK